MITRRTFIASTIGMSQALFLESLWQSASAQDVDPRLAQTLKKTVGIDMHNHVYPKGTEPHPHFAGHEHGHEHGPGGGGADRKPEDKSEAVPAEDVSLEEELKQSGLAAVCASFVLDFAPSEKLGDSMQNYLHWLDAIDAQLEQGHIKRALNLKDLENAHKSKKPTIVQTVEGAMFIEGKLERIEQVYKRGLRHLQLLHEHDDKVAPLGDVNTAASHLGGLTVEGIEVVKECNRLGILIDMAHGSHETVAGVLKISKQPIIISHTNLDTWTGSNARLAEMMKPRLISKEHAKAVADAGGIVGVWTHLTDSLPEFVQSIKAMVDAIGVDHVGIGTDTDLLSLRTKAGTNFAYPDLKEKFFPAVVAEMLKQGFSPEDVEKIGGGNYCRVFGLVTAKH